jgi:type I restriction enzyme S subunit
LLHITKGTIENWECSIPKSKEEQQKIASCLSSLDVLIAAQAERIEQLKRHKKGLMQGLFPKIES